MDGDDDLMIINEWDDSQSAPKPSTELNEPEEPAAGTEEEAEGFDLTTSTEWIYPTNYPIRDYQKNIVTNALFKNTLVSLPTGLGKTFIAAVVMYNFHRWYPKHKVVFMAHSKPLVSQQVQACCDIMGIPKKITAELNGTISLAQRKQHWENRRIFFLTPQVFNNDLSRGLVSPESIRCVVVDEAHKALGNQAYCQAVKALKPFNRNFRVLALSATPGDDIAAVKAVVENLLISHLELRTEDDPDIKKYLYGRKVEAVVVNLDSKIIQYRDQLFSVADKYLRHLVQAKAISGSFGSLSSFSLVLKQKQFLSNPSVGPDQRGFVLSNFSVVISLLKASEELIVHGLRSFHGKLLGIKSGEGSSNNVHNRLSKDTDFEALIAAVEQYIGKDRDIAFDPNVSMARLQDELDAQADGPRPPIVYSHPKFVVLEEIITQHFEAWSEKEQSTKVIVFCKSRPCTGEICNFLNRFRPLVKPMVLIGQSNSTGGSTSRGLKQSAQLEVMRKFRAGSYNTLVATCVGEEGLDVGEVDLIINFDASRNSNTQVQRAGRTGRKREGRVVNLVTEGKEYQDYNIGCAKAKTMSKKLATGVNNLPLYANSPRLLPKGLNPVCQEMFLKPPTETPGKNKTKCSATSKKPPSKRRKKDPPHDLQSSQSNNKYDIRYALSQAQKRKKVSTGIHDDSSGSLFEAVGAVEIFKEYQKVSKKVNDKGVGETHGRAECSRKDVEIVNLDDSLEEIHDGSANHSLESDLLNSSTIKDGVAPVPIDRSPMATLGRRCLSAVKLPLDAEACDVLDGLSLDELVTLAAKNFMAVRITGPCKGYKIAPIVGNPWRTSSAENSPNSSEIDEPLDCRVKWQHLPIPMSREDYLTNFSLNRSLTDQTSEKISGFHNVENTSFKVDSVKDTPLDNLKSVVESKKAVTQHPVYENVPNCFETSGLLRQFHNGTGAEAQNESGDFSLGNCVDSTHFGDSILETKIKYGEKSGSELLNNVRTTTELGINEDNNFRRPQTCVNSRNGGLILENNRQENALESSRISAKCNEYLMDIGDTEDVFINNIDLSRIENSFMPCDKVEVGGKEAVPLELMAHTAVKSSYTEAGLSTTNNKGEVSMVTVTQALGMVASFNAKNVNFRNISEQRSQSMENCGESTFNYNDAANVNSQTCEKSGSSSPVFGASCLPLLRAKKSSTESTDDNNGPAPSEKQSSQQNSPSSSVFKLNGPSLSNQAKKSSVLSGDCRNETAKSSFQTDRSSSPVFRVSQKVRRKTIVPKSPVFSISHKSRRRPLQELFVPTSKENADLPCTGSFSQRTVNTVIPSEAEKKNSSARKSLLFADTPKVTNIVAKPASEKTCFQSDSDDDLFVEAEKELKYFQTQQMKEKGDESPNTTQVYSPERISPSILILTDDFTVPSVMPLVNSSTPVLPPSQRNEDKPEIDDDFPVPLPSTSDSRRTKNKTEDSEIPKKTDSIATCDDSMPFHDNLATFKEKMRCRSEHTVKTPPKVAVVRPMTSVTMDLSDDAGWISTANKPKSPSLLSIIKPKRKNILGSQSCGVLTPKFGLTSSRSFGVLHSSRGDKNLNKSLSPVKPNASTLNKEGLVSFDCFPEDLADFLMSSHFEENQQSTPIAKGGNSTSKDSRRYGSETCTSNLGSTARFQEKKVGDVLEVIPSDGELSDDALEAIRAVEEFEKKQRLAETSAKSTKSDVVFDVWDSDDSGDLFEKKAASSHGPLKEDPPLKKKQKKNTKCFRRKKSNPFIVSEAEFSDDGAAVSSEDENSSGLDEMDSSFLDERIAPTQAPNVDMTAKYLSTVRSPPVVTGGFKIPNPVSPDFPLYSQIDPNDNDYERDSFCVDDFEEENQEMSALELAELILDKRKKRRRMETPQNKVVNGKKKRRRIVVIDSSSDEEKESAAAGSKPEASSIKALEVAPPPRAAVTATPSSSSVASRSIVPAKASPPLVFIGSRQIAGTPDIATALRAKWKFLVEVRSSPGADYIVSWRVGINRITLSDFCNGSPIVKASLKESIIRLIELFVKPVLIIEDDKNKAAPRTVGCHKNLWAKHSAKRLARLRHAGVTMLFTKDKDETAKIIALLTRTECEKNYGVVTDWKNISPALETKLSFYCSLPGINVANALRLCRKYSTLSSFLTVCDSLAAIKRELEVPHSIAVNIYHALHSAPST